jgi:hypothetical protein
MGERKEIMMKRGITLIIALGMALVFSSVVLAGEFCSSGHSTQVSTEKPDASKTVATPAPEKLEMDKVQVAQTDRPAKPAPEVKK